MKTITIANQKGGVGKTTTAVTLAHGLAMCQQHTLLADLDPQGHVAFALGIEKAPGMYRLIVDEEPIEKVAIPVRDHLDIITGDKRTEKAKRTVVISNYPTEILGRLFKQAEYDVVILDLAPSLDVLHVSALMASDWVIIPTKLDAMAVDGVNEVLRSMSEVVERGHWTDYLNFLSRFHRYSFNNLLLILFQFPGATRCTSYRTWSQLGRQVRKGEKGIEILVPILARFSDGPKTTKTENESPDRLDPEPNEGQRETASGYRLVGFKVGHTFDVSQTEGAPLPELVTLNLMGDDQGVYAALAGFAQDVLHIAVELGETEDPHWGGACSYDESGQAIRIVVAGNRSALFRAQTLAHELGHALLHSDKEYRAHTPRSRIECEAESVSYCILYHFGLEVGEVAFGYLALWGDGADALKELMECGSRIREAAHQVIAWIEEHDAYLDDPG